MIKFESEQNSKDVRGPQYMVCDMAVIAPFFRSSYTAAI